MITKSERQWIDNQLTANGLKGQAAQKFTSETIDYFERKRKQPRKSDFATVKMTEVLPGYQEYLKTMK
jgi:hypothetical protein